MNKNCILIIDDDGISREVLKNLFSSQYVVEEAANGYAGLDKIITLRKSLCAVLLDVNMPLMNGIELLQSLKKTGITSEVPIFLVTSPDDSALIRQAYELGAIDIIYKPITAYIVQRRVASICELFRSRAMLRSSIIAQEQELIENYNTIDKLHRGTIETLAAAIEFRNVESGEHSRHIYDITKIILSETEMGEGFTLEEIENISIGSIMHDIGKIAISDVILNKPARLTKEEYEIMKEHTVKGAQLMDQLSNMQTHDSYYYARDIARHHHERWDGNGYPDGLKGDEISVWSQVVSIADVYDALVSPRVYKEPYSYDEAVRMITTGECGVFNPKLIDCFKAAEPKIRQIYENSLTADLLLRPIEPKPATGATSLAVTAEKIQLSQNVTEVLLLIAALKSVYDLIIFANLSKNTYNLMNFASLATHVVSDTGGAFDDLIVAGAGSIPEEDKQRFVDNFSRNSLLKAYESGKYYVDLLHKQYDDSGSVLNTETIVILMRDSVSGDIYDITLSKRVETAQSKGR